MSGNLLRPPNGRAIKPIPAVEEAAQLHVRIPAGLQRRSNILAARLDRSMSEPTEKALAVFVAPREEEA